MASELIAEAITDYLGCRCPDHDDNCFTCQAWAEYDRLYTRPAPAATDTGLVSNCDGKEQEAFETWAKSKRYDMHEHPMHYLFLDPKTNAAREGWNEAIRYCHSQAVELLAAERVKNETQAETIDKLHGIITKLEADNAAKDARIKELDDECNELVAKCNEMIGQRDYALNTCAQMEEDKDALEAKLAAAEKALEPFAEAAEMALISGNPPGNHVDAICFLEARAVWRGKPS